MAAVLTLSVPQARRGLYSPLLFAATLLAFCVVGLGAYVRLADAGLGCPDWPGCYGHLVGVPDSQAEHAAAASAFPGKPVEVGKAWKEMLHRYAAGTLGLLILGIALSAWSAWRRAGKSRPWLETGLVGLVAFQALLGMWTVTLLLKPAIVTAHLVGGMAIWAILATLTARELGAGGTASRSGAIGAIGAWSLALVALQIALGGWVSSNYAALACPDFPTCRGAWLPIDGPTAIHMTHRLGAVLVFCIVGTYSALLLKRRQTIGWLIAALLGLQVALGIANVLLSLPLPVAVAHNLGAALLLASLVFANIRRY